MAAILTDFGLAKSTATGSKYTRTGQALGTPAYMSPEQARGEIADLTPASDVWSLGCVLWELLAGAAPFAADTSAAVIGRILTEQPPPLGAVHAGAPAGLDAVLRRALAKAATARYPSARGFHADLVRVLAGVRPLARRRRPVALGIAAGAVAAAVAGAMAFGLRRLPADAVATPAGVAAESEAERAWETRLTDLAAATAGLRRAVAASPQRHDGRLRLGLCRWAAGDVEDARAIWRDIPAPGPWADRRDLYLGLSAVFTDDDSVALPWLQRIMAGTGFEARLAQAAWALTEDRFAEAREILRGLPGWEAALLRGQADALDPRGDREGAVRAYTEALAGGPPLALVYFNRGSCRGLLGDHAGEVEDCTAALRLDPGHVGALANRGMARSTLGDHVGAIEDLTALLARGPDAEAWINRGVAREELGDVTGALADYSAALGHAPGLAAAWLNRGRLREATGDDTRAQVDLDEALRLDPDSTDARTVRAGLRDRLGDPAGAMADLDAAVAAAPRHVDARGHRASLRGRMGDFTGAIADLDVAIGLEPGDAKLWVNRGIAKSKSGDEDGAQADFESAVRADAAEPLAHANLAMARAASGDLGGALTAAEAALALMTEETGAAGMRRLRDQLRADLGLPPVGG